jgi:hypothetical protein
MRVPAWRAPAAICRRQDTPRSLFSNTLRIFA